MAVRDAGAAMGAGAVGHEKQVAWEGSNAELAMTLPCVTPHSVSISTYLDASSWFLPMEMVLAVTSMG